MTTPQISINNVKPGIVVVEDFLNNPHEHREYALGLDYEKKGSYGVRSAPHQYPEYREAFEKILQRRIVGWHSDINGCYQWCDKHQDIVYHVDLQSYAAVLFLTPDAPVASGTSFWKSKHTGQRIHHGNQTGLTFGPNGEHLKDPDQWELVDRVGNAFNRLVIWYGQYIHSATEYFGEDVHDSRLFQIFFFDCE
jgi:hypothetical protein